MIEGKKGVLLIARMTGVKIVPLGMTGSDKVLPINQDGNMTGEKLHKGTIDIRVGKSFKVPEKTPEQSKEEYDQFALNYIMTRIAELLPTEYQGIYRL